LKFLDQNKAIKIIFVLSFSLLAAFIVTLYFQDLFMANTIISPKQGSNYISIDARGIPYVNYKEGISGMDIEVQRNPVTTVHTVMDFYEEYKNAGNTTAKQYFINNVDWLVDNSRSNGNYSLLEYSFDFPKYNLQSPWRSAMANGEALIPLLRAHELTGDIKYLDTATKFLNAFYVDVRDGGITYKDSPTEWWYEEYATDDNNSQVSRVLNGMLFALLGIYDYYNYTGSDDAKYVFVNGVNSVIKNLAKYDNNGYSYYDVLFTPALKYHQIHIDLLNKLYDITKQEIFQTYSKKWALYESTNSVWDDINKRHLVWNFSIMTAISIFSVLTASKLRTKSEM
jgi:hypothetical protein